MMTCKLVNYESSLNAKSKNKDNSIDESTMNYDADEYVIMHILEQVQQEIQASSSQLDSHFIEYLVKENQKNKGEIITSHSPSETSELLVASVNLFSILPLKEYIHPN